MKAQSKIHSKALNDRVFATDCLASFQLVKSNFPKEWQQLLRNYCAQIVDYSATNNCSPTKTLEVLMANEKKFPTNDRLVQSEKIIYLAAYFCLVNKIDLSIPVDKKKIKSK